jgi:hypothetical protein
MMMTQPTGTPFTGLPHQFGQIGKTEGGITTVTKPYVMSKGNGKTLDTLKKNQNVPQADLTRLLNYLIKTKDKETFNDVSNKIYQQEKQKHPDWDNKKVIDGLVKRIKGKEGKDFIRTEYEEIIIPSNKIPKIKKPKFGQDEKGTGKQIFEEVLKPKDLKDKTQFEEMITKGIGKQVDSGLIDKGVVVENSVVPWNKPKVPDFGQPIPDVKTGGGLLVKPKPVAKPTAGKSNFDNISEFFDTSSNLYAKNKGLIDGVANAMTPENMESGAWLTDLASMGAPEIKIVSELMKFTPLGASAKDYVALENIKRGKPSGLSQSEEQMLAFKSIVNPDLLGKGVERVVDKISTDVGDALSTTWGKITGHKLPDKKTEVEVESAEAIKARLDAQKKKTDKQTYIDGLMADPNAKVYPAMPAGFGKTGGSSGAFNPKTGESAFKPVMTAEQYLTPPDAGSFGYSDPTVMDDIGRWFGKIFGLNNPYIAQAPANKEEYIAQMKQFNPDLYARYEKEMDAYNWKLYKSTLSGSSTVDPSYQNNKTIIETIGATNNALIKKAKSLKQLTQEQAEESYDINESLKSIMKGESSMTYDDILKINTHLINSFGKDVVKLALPDIQPMYDTIDSLLSEAFPGDSKIDVTADTTYKAETETQEKPKIGDKLGDDTQDTQDTKPTEPDKPESKDTGKNSLVKEERIEVGQYDKFPRLRGRLHWGGTDELLIRKPEEVKNADIFSELMSVNPAGWYNGAGNKLYLSNEKTDDMRYGSTLPLSYNPKEYAPNPKYFNTRPSSANMRKQFSYHNESTDDSFNEYTRPIMTSQYPPMDGFKFARDQYDIGQFQKPTPKEFQDVYPINWQYEYHNYFPNVINAETGGLPQVVRTGNPQNEYIIQQRFTRR